MSTELTSRIGTASSSSTLWATDSLNIGSRKMLRVVVEADEGAVAPRMRRVLKSKIATSGYANTNSSSATIGAR